MNLVKKFMPAMASLVCSLTITAQGIAPLSEAEWITGSTYAAMPRYDMVEGVVLPLFRKVTTCDAPTERATLTAAALGVHDIIVNGQHVEGHELKPGWTNYRKEATCQTMDITPLLSKGEKKTCTQLSYGWWAGEISRGVYGRHTPLALKAEVVIDGQCVARTDDIWQCSYGGPLLLLLCEIYVDEVYDARRTPTEWEGVTVLKHMPMAVIPFEGPEVRIRDKALWRHLQTVTATEEMRISKIIDQVVGSEIEEWGEFACSDAIINQLYKRLRGD